jgi:hypothetical protein
MKLTIFLTACSLGLVLGKEVQQRDNSEIDPPASCYNRDDARKDARSAGCYNVDSVSHAGTYCNVFGCNCEWGCTLESGSWQPRVCPDRLGVSNCFAIARRDDNIF